MASVDFKYPLLRNLRYWMECGAPFALMFASFTTTLLHVTPACTATLVSAEPGAPLLTADGNRITGAGLWQPSSDRCQKLRIR